MLRAVMLMALLGAAMPLPAHDAISTKITWSREIARVVYRHCLECHAENGAAFSLATYAAARPWAAAIKEEVLMRRMPPWNAVKGFGHFANDRGLTQQELSLIADWVEGGAPEGDPKYLPALPAGLKAPAAPPATRSMDAPAVLARPVEALGVRVVTGTLQLVAIRPDGSVEPLVWVQRSNPRDPGTYWFRSRLRLPAQTRLQVIPAGGKAELLIR